ncbi:hypothetical protein V2A60_003729 [Cordyceps javanica]
MGAYPQSPQHNFQSGHFAHTDSQRPESQSPLPAAHAQTAADNPYVPQPIGQQTMVEPMICQGCDAGLVPGDIAYCCDECKNGVSTFCEPCHRSGKRCYHGVTPAKLEASRDLKNEDKDGDFGFGLKCDGCKTKLKQGMLCWHCKRCFDPNFCKDCWKRRDKRCKHASQGKVQLRKVGKSSVTTEDILDGLDTVGSILGG